MKKIQQYVVWLAVLSLALESISFTILGKDLKLWTIAALLGGILVVHNVWKKGFKKERFTIGYFGLAFLLVSLPGIFLYSPVAGYAFQQWIILFLAVALGTFFGYFSQTYRKDIYLGLALGILISSIAGIYQNIALELGLPHYEVMLARPNAFFHEPDWLGIYLVLTLAVFLPLVGRGRENLKYLPKLLKKRWTIEALVTLGLITLIITVARASWLAALVEIFAVILLISYKGYVQKGLSGLFKETFRYKINIIPLIFLAIAAVYLFNLTRFNLTDRVRSIFFQEHIITQAYDPRTGEQLKIDLEEVDYYKGMGYEIREGYVEDENVVSREENVKSSWEIVKEHPLIGSGLGIVLIETNFEHNANNLFFEWWTSAGILGLIVLIAAIICILWRGIKVYRIEPEVGMAIISGILAFTVVNVFNATIFLAVAWFFWGWSLSWNNLKRFKSNI